MKRFLAALLLTSSVAGVAHAQRITGAMSNAYTAPRPPLLASMGTLDKALYGGIDLSSVGTAPITLVSVKNNTTGLTCISTCDHTIDGWGHLVWSGTYGGAITASPGASYTDVVQDANGFLQTINITVRQNYGYVRSHYVGPNYTIAGYSLTNPDTPTSFQLATYANSASTPLDATILIRDESGSTGLTPALNPYAWQLANGAALNYQINFPGTAGGLSSWVASDGSGGAKVTDNGSAGTTLTWTTMTDHKGTGLNCAHTLYIMGPGIADETTGTCISAPGTGAGSLTLSKPLRSDFVAGETVTITPRLVIASEHPNTGVDRYGNPHAGGLAEIGSLRPQSNAAADFPLPVTFQDITFTSDVAPAGPPSVFCGYMSSNSAGGALLHVLAYADGQAANAGKTSYGNCTGISRGTIALQQGMSGWNKVAPSGLTGPSYIIRTAANSSGLDCDGSTCTGTGNPNPAIGTEETYRVDSGNATPINQTTPSGTPQQYAAGLWGTGGGVPGNTGPNCTAGCVQTQYAFNSASGWGMLLKRIHLTLGSHITDSQIERNYLFGLQGQAIQIVDSWFDRYTVPITTNPSGYTQRNGGAVDDACTGSGVALTCAQNFIIRTRGTRYTTDFIDETTNTADTTAEDNFAFDTRPNIGMIRDDIGDQITITDVTAGTPPKKYTFVASVTGGGNVDGNIPYALNMAQMMVNIACTINAAHGGYVQMSPFYPSSDATKSWNNTAPLNEPCVDGVNLPAAEVADVAAVATIDTLHMVPNIDLPLLPVTPGDTLSFSFWSASFNQTQTSGTSQCTGAPCVIGQFSADPFSSSTTLTVKTPLSSGQVVVGGALTVVSGTVSGVVSTTRVLSYSGAGAPGGPGNYVLSNAISCATVCVFKQTIPASGPAIQIGTLHPDFMQDIGLNIALHSNPMPYSAHRNIYIGTASNFEGGQGYSFNGGTKCCFIGDVGNNIHFNYLTNGFSFESQHNTSIYRNTIMQDVAAPWFDATDTTGYNFLWAMTSAAPMHDMPPVQVNEACIPDDIGNNTGNTATSNISNAFAHSTSTSCIGGAPFTESPTVQVASGWLGAESLVGVSSPAARYAAMFPNYPAVLNRGTQACGTTRVAVLACLAPARGVTFNATLDSSCNITVTDVLMPVEIALNVHINGPGIPAVGATSFSAHITSVSGHAATMTGIGGAGKSCVAQGSPQIYATGAMNVDGTYSGALFPADNLGVISWNDGTVFNPAAVHTPAT